MDLFRYIIEAGRAWRFPQRQVFGIWDWRRVLQKNSRCLSLLILTSGMGCKRSLSSRFENRLARPICQYFCNIFKVAICQHKGETTEPNGQLGKYVP